LRRSLPENNCSTQICKVQALKVLLAKAFMKISYHFSILNWEEPLYLNILYCNYISEFPNKTSGRSENWGATPATPLSRSETICYFLNTASCTGTLFSRKSLKCLLRTFSLGAKGPGKHAWCLLRTFSLGAKGPGKHAWCLLRTFSLRPRREILHELF